MTDEGAGYDIHRDAEAVIDDEALAAADRTNALESILDLQWVISAARHTLSEHPVTDEDRVRLIALTLQAIEDKMDLLGLT